MICPCLAAVEWSKTEVASVDPSDPTKMGKRAAEEEDGEADVGALSKRGKRVMNTPLLPYMAGVIDGAVNPYSLETGQGVFALAVAENKLAHDVLEPRVKAAFANMPTPTFSYNIMHGWQSARESVAALMREHFCKDVKCVGPVADEIICTAGAAAALTHIFYCICEAGDVCLVPSPYYSAFDYDLSALAEVKINPVPLAPENGYALTPAMLDDACKRAEREQGRFPRVLLLTNPHNPLGRIMPPAELQALMDWCDAHEVHLVADEIYALSCFGQHLTSSTSKSFVSIGEMLKGTLGPRRHVVWALSKDFGASGWRAGILWTQNKALHEAVSHMAVFSGIAGPLQSVIEQIFNDRAFMEAYLVENSKRLAASCDLVTKALREMEIPYLQPEGGMFVWCDCRQLLKLALPSNPASNEAEDSLYNALWKEARVVITPGLAQHQTEPGWFRVCFAAVKPAVLELAMQSFKEWVASRKASVAIQS